MCSDLDLSKWQPKRESPIPAYMQIESWLEGIIFEQVLPAHAPLPAVTELADHCHVSALTAHKAYRRLKARGLVYTIVGSGTFVAPVDQNRFVGLLIHREVLAAAVSSPSILLYLNEIHRQLAAAGFKDRMIVDSTPREVGTRNMISADAMSLLDQQALQGLVAVLHEGSDELFDLLKRRSVPSVGLNVEGRDYDSAMEFRQDLFITEALERVADMGLVDVGVMYFDDPDKLDEHRVGYLQRISRSFDLHGLRMRPEWVVGVGSIDDSGGYHAFEHLWRAPRRPRALIIVDDVVARSAMMAVMARHVRVPDDLDVSVLGNESSPLVFPRTWARWHFKTKDTCARLVAQLKGRLDGLDVAKVFDVVPQQVRDMPAGQAPFDAKIMTGFRTADQIAALAAG